MKGNVPKSVVLDGQPSCQQELEEYLSKKAGRSIQLLIPQKGDQMKLLSMAKENASQQIAEQTRRTSRENFCIGRACKAFRAAESSKLY